MTFKLSPILNADSYKFLHINLYPKGITEVYSNFTPRSVKHLNVPSKYKNNEIIWFGGQAVVQDMVDLWDDEFFSLPIKDGFGFGRDIDTKLKEFSRIIAPFAGADYKVEHLYDLHALGYLPLEIKTLPEGSHVPVGVPVLTVRNTKPEFFWLTNFIESYLSAELWKMSTSATIASYYRKIIENWAEKTGGNKDFIDFQAHDFSYRGMSGSMDAVKSGSGHLTSFKGSDTVPAIPYLEYHYSGKDTFIGASVPATEHSIQTAFVENDYEYIRYIIQDCVPKGIVSVVADGYDYWSVLTDVLPRLKDVIMNREPDAMGFAKTVIRPDSGDPVEIICGNEFKDWSHYDDVETLQYSLAEYIEYQIAEETAHGECGESTITNILQHKGKYYQYTVEIDWNRYDKQYYYTDGSRLIDFDEVELTAEQKGSVQVLWDLFGGTTNDKGYKTLDQHIGLIYGDSITLERAEEILRRLEAKGFASDNIVLGIGSYSYNYNTRDTLGFAMKSTNITQNGKDIPLFKNPKTDDGTKKSAKGLLSVIHHPTLGEDRVPTYVLYNDVSRENEKSGVLTTLFKDGDFKKHETLEEIRNRIKDNNEHSK